MKKVAAALALVVSVAAAATVDEAAQLREAVSKLDPTLKVEDARISPVAGLLRASVGGAQGYITSDGRYFIVGDMFEVATRRNLTETGREQLRREVLASIDPASVIRFGPAKAKHSVTVFTDVDCGYCRKLHSEISQYLEQGIAVNYVAFPRTGPGSDSWTRMEAVWCSKDTADALTRAKLGEAMTKPADCKSTPVAAHYALGQRLALQGTPTIVLPDGRAFGGYVSATQLSAALQKKNAVAVAQAAGSKR